MTSKNVYQARSSSGFLLIFGKTKSVCFRFNYPVFALFACGSASICLDVLKGF
jgi:hypothetical protein